MSKTFIKTSVIKAIDMDRPKAETHFNKRIVLGDGLSGDGYLVTTDKGSTSWFPKEVIESSYSKFTSDLEKIQFELSELNKKIEKYTSIIKTQKVKRGDYVLISNQISCMKECSRILSQRILIHSKNKIK